MTIPAKINVTVCYATPETADVRAVAVPVGATIKAALARSGLLRDHDEINLDVNKVGVYGELASLTTILAEGDRVEVYRPAAGNQRQLRTKCELKD